MNERPAGAEFFLRKGLDSKIARQPDGHQSARHLRAEAHAFAPEEAVINASRVRRIMLQREAVPIAIDRDCRNWKNPCFRASMAAWEAGSFPFCGRRLDFGKDINHAPFRNCQE
jgi:hypothetical protein